MIAASRALSRGVALARSNLGMSLAATGLMVGLSLVTSVIVARQLGPEGRGALLALSFWPAIAAGIANLSLNESAAYHIARTSGPGGDGGVGYARAALPLQAAIALLGAAAALALGWAAFPRASGPPLPALLAFAALFAGFSILDQHFKAVLQGRGRFARLNALRLAQPLAYAAALIAAVIGPGLDLAFVLAAMLAGLTVSLLAGALVARMERAAPIVGAPAAARQDLLRTGWTFHRANMLLYLAAEIDKLIALALLSAAAVGLYAVALAYSAIGAGLVTQSLALVLSREMAAAAAPLARQQVFLRAVRLAFGLTLAVNGIAAAAAWAVLPALFGPEFAPAAAAAALLLAGGLAKAVRQTIDRAMRAMHVTRVGIIGETSALIAAIPLAALGAQSGLAGFAAGIAAANVVGLGLAFAMACRILKIPAMSLFVGAPGGPPAPLQTKPGDWAP